MFVNNNRMLLLTLTLFFFVRNSSENITAPSREVSLQLGVYLLTNTVSFAKNYDTVGIIVYDEGRTDPVVSYFIHRKLRYPTLVANVTREFRKAPLMENIRTIFCFIERYVNIKEALEYMTTYTFFKLTGRIKFVISTPVANINWLNDTFDYLWSWYVLNFVLVFEFNGQVEIVSKNPFINRTLNFTNNYNKKNVFLDKLENLEGYKLTSVMYQDEPRHKMVNGELWGRDVNLFKELSRFINAVPNVLMVPKGLQNLQDALRNNTANFSFIKQFTFANIDLSTSSYPLELDYISVLVPTPGLIPQYSYLFDVFSNTLWYCLFGALILVIAFTWSFRQYSLGKSTTIIMQILLYVPYDKLDNAVRPLRIFLMSWVVFALLLAIGFNTELRSSLTTAKYEHEITTLEDVARSKIPVGCSKTYLSTILDEMKMVQGQLVDMKGIVQAVQKYNKDKAYVLPLSFADILQRQRDKSNRQIYKILNQHVAGGFSVYSYQNNSPFKTKFDTLLLLFREFDLGSFGLDYVPTKSVQESENAPLSLLHLQTAFYLMFLGNALSLIAFITELVYFKIKNGRQNKIESE